MDPATALAPPPGWTPPQPSSPTPMDVNPATMGGTPPVMPPPTQPDVQDPSVIPNYAPSTAGATDPEIAAGHAHQTWLGHIMDVVGSILGGDQTIHVTKSPDGTMTVTHDPSTGAEKWGRVAQAALVGGAAGLANGQGPGGTARAIAAGVQAGTQQAPQQLAQANQEAAQMNAQQLAKANMALLNQKVVMGTMGMREQNIAMTDADVARANNNAAYLLANPANRRLGEIKDISELPDFAAKNADLINQHANGQIHTQTELGSDGKPHVGVYLVDQNWMNQKNDKPYTYSRLAPGKTLDDPMTLQDVTVPPGAHTNGELMATHESEDAKIADYKIKLANADAKTDKPITNPLALQVQLERTTDPAERSRLQAALDADQRRRVQIATASRAPAAPTSTSSPGGIMGAQFGGGDPNSSFERNAQMLARGDQVLSQLRIMRGKGQPTQADYVARADQIDRANGGTGYDPATVGTEYKNANEQKTQDVIKAIDRAIGRPGQAGQIDQLIKLSDAAHLSNAPLIGGLINRGALTAGNVAGDKDAQNLLNSIEDTRATFSALIGNPLLGGSETDKKLERAKAMIGNYPTPDNLRSAKNDVLVPALQTQRDAITGSNRFLRRQYGTSTELSPLEMSRRAATSAPTPTPPAATPTPTSTPTPTPPAAQATPPANLVPLGHATTFGNGQVWQNMNGVITRIK